MAKIEVSNGELYDKMSILRIKSGQMTENEKLANVYAEIAALEPEFNRVMEECKDKRELGVLYNQLLHVNLELWKIEDELRELERLKDFTNSFIHHARLVYKTNDQRAILKRKINDLTESRLVEEKSYEEY